MNATPKSFTFAWRFLGEEELKQEVITLDMLPFHKDQAAALAIACERAGITISGRDYKGGPNELTTFFGHTGKFSQPKRNPARSVEGMIYENR